MTVKFKRFYQYVTIYIFLTLASNSYADVALQPYSQNPWNGYTYASPLGWLNYWRATNNLLKPSIQDVLNYHFQDAVNDTVNNYQSLGKFNAVPNLPKNESNQSQKPKGLVDEVNNPKYQTEKQSNKQEQSKSILEQFFTQGTYTLAALANYLYFQPNNYFSYGASVFMQSGEIAGFSVGGNYLFINPWFSNDINPTANNSLPTNKVATISQLFLEYNLKDHIQADIGWLYINTPWLTSYTPTSTTQPTYRGALVNYKITNHWLLTGLAINGYKGLAQTSFNRETMYSYNINPNTFTPQIGSGNSEFSTALGIQYSLDRTLNAGIWGYIFYNYASMLYAYGGNSFILNKQSAITLNLQAASQGTVGSGSNVFSDNGLQSPEGQLLGAEITYSYNNASLTLAYNGLIGSGGFSNGNLVSPYTFQLANDPLYTTSYMGGVIENSASNAIKIFPAISFFDQSLVIAPSYAYYDSDIFNNSAEWDFIVTYQVPEVTGLQLIGVYAVMQTFPATTLSNLVQFSAAYLF